MDSTGTIDGAFTDIDDAYSSMIYGTHTLVEVMVHGLIPTEIVIRESDQSYRPIRVYPEVSDQELRTAIWKTVEEWNRRNELEEIHKAEFDAAYLGSPRQPELPL
jgi:hypothetical protein